MKTALKICLAASLLLGFRLDAQESGYYQPLSYRNNDPFLFCTKGQDPMKNPAPCWKPVPPYTGQYKMMPYCRPPNPYGKAWTADDIRSLAEYLAVCPNAETSGPWNGGGIPETSPNGRWH